MVCLSATLRRRHPVRRLHQRSPRRLQQHNAGQGAKYTRFRRPVSLVYLEQAGDHGQALRREAALKRLTAKEKLALIAAAPPLSDPPIPTEKKTP